MAVYNYVARDTQGVSLSGTYTDIDSVGVLRDELAKMGYVLVRARRARKSKKKRGRIGQSEIATFAYKFAGMYSAGLPILRCLETLEQQTDNRALRQVITDIRIKVGTGSSLTGAFSKYRDLFSDFFLGMIEAGEVGGKLGETLEMSAVYLEKRAALKEKVKSAFAYPIIVTAMCFVVIAFLLIFVIPVFSKLYRQVHAELPGPTLFLITVSSFLKDWWWAVIIIIVAAALLARRLAAKGKIRARWDDFKLSMPVFGKLNRMVVVSHFTRTLAMLCSVGVSVIKALDMAGVVADNHTMTGVTRDIQRAIESGTSVADSMKEHEIFPPIVTQLAASGEEVGVLPEMLNKGADILDKDIDRTVSALLTRLEPALTLIMGAVVAFILMGAYLPMFDYIGHLK